MCYIGPILTELKHECLVFFKIWFVSTGRHKAGSRSHSSASKYKCVGHKNKLCLAIIWYCSFFLPTYCISILDQGANVSVEFNSHIKYKKIFPVQHHCKEVIQRKGCIFSSLQYSITVCSQSFFSSLSQQKAACEKLHYYLNDLLNSIQPWKPQFAHSWTSPPSAKIESSSAVVIRRPKLGNCLCRWLLH